MVPLKESFDIHFCDIKYIRFPKEMDYVFIYCNYTSCWAAGKYFQETYPEMGVDPALLPNICRKEY